MAGSIINTKITHGVTLGSAGYPSPLTITSAGDIAPSTAGATALYATISAGYVQNQGGIAGAAGGAGITGAFSGVGGTGGTGACGGNGADLAGGSLVNGGAIAGGSGGAGGTGGEGTGLGGTGGTGGAGGSGVNLTGGSLINDGTIAGGQGGFGGFGGEGFIGSGGFGGFGGTGGVGVDVAAGSLTNNGTITGGQFGVGGGGGIGDTNAQAQPGGPGLGGIGVLFQSGGTLTNAGFIGGGSGLVGIADAVNFGNGASRLILDPGASFSGSVVANSASSNVLELASGAGAGTLAGAGSQITGFANVTIDAGASWTLVSATLGAAYTITDAGTLTNAGNLSGAGVTVVAGGSLINDGTIAGGEGAFSKGIGGAGAIAISVDAAGGSLTNDGMIAGGTAGNGLNGGGGGGDGISLAGGSLTNTSGATITGGAGGNAGYGFSSGRGGNGVDLAGGSLTNALGATIDGGDGGTVGGTSGSGGNGGNGGDGVDLAGGSLVNDGMIAGGNGGAFFSDAKSGSGGNGVDLASGSLTNTSGASITGGSGAAGGTGVLFQSGGTLTDAGFIAGGNGGAAHAVDFGSGAARLILDPGASFTGAVVANGSYSNVLELASAGSAGTIAGLGSGITGFGTVQFDANATWLIEGNSSGLATGQVVNDFAFGDTIELTGFIATGRTFIGAGLGLALTGTGGSELIGIQGNFVTSDFTVTNNGSDSFIELNTLCFLRGTHILTDQGEVEVERLAVGDHVVTHSGKVTPIEWIGTGKVLATRGRRNAATPVIVRKGALADNVPHRDLRVTKGHSLFVGGVLIPVEYLVNHRSILWDDQAQEVEIYHVELATHDVLLADGAPAESYRDDGNRWLFQNANSGWSLPPKTPCAPVLTGGPVVDAVWMQLLERSGRRPGLPMTSNPDLHLLVNGQRLDPAQCVGDTYIFQLPGPPDSVRITSRSVALQELGLARDPRRLGVALRRMTVRRGTAFRVTKAADARLTDGFHAYEADNDFRWTDGDAGVPTEVFTGFTGPMEILLTATSTEQYVEDGYRRAAA